MYMKNKTGLTAFVIVALFILAFFNSCNKDKNTEPAIVNGTMTDIDGNVYTTVKINDKWWMAANLKVKKISQWQFNKICF